MWQLGLPRFRSAKSIDHDLPKRKNAELWYLCKLVVVQTRDHVLGVRENTCSHSNYALQRQERRSQRITSSAIESIRVSERRRRMIMSQIVPSRNVPLTGSLWRGRNGNTAHDANWLVALKKLKLLPRLPITCLCMAAPEAWVMWPFNSRKRLDAR